MIATLPTKTDLLKNNIVDIDLQHKKVITNTLQVADHFGKRPSNVNQRIASLSKRGRLKVKPSYYLNQQGKEQKYYELNRDQFLLVVMGFTGDKADQFKADFIRLFNQQETELQQWRKQAHLTTDSTKQANDQVYQLQKDLAEVIPNSKRCTLLFVHIQQAITKTVTGSAKTERAMMTTCQLYQVGQLEQKVQTHIERLKHEGITPEQIRDDVLAMIKATGKEKPPPATKPKEAYIMPLNNINHLTAKQHLLQQAQALAARLPETGLKPDKLTQLPLDDLVGTLAYLKWVYAEKVV